MLVAGVTALCLCPNDMEGRIIVGGGDGIVELVEEVNVVTVPNRFAVHKVKMQSLPHLLVVSKLEFNTHI
jgi:hypothetical protein